jgi:hypothetical protein
MADTIICEVGATLARNTVTMKTAATNVTIVTNKKKKNRLEPEISSKGNAYSYMYVELKVYLNLLTRMYVLRVIQKFYNRTTNSNT